MKQKRDDDKEDDGKEVKGAMVVLFVVFILGFSAGKYTSAVQCSPLKRLDASGIVLKKSGALIEQRRVSL